MNQKFFIYFSAAMLGFSTSALAYTDLEKYKPTLDSGSAFFDSAADVVFTKVDEDSAAFASYEVVNGKWEKVYYDYSVTIKDGVVSHDRVINTNAIDNVTGHFIGYDGTSDTVFLNDVSVDRVSGDFINNTNTTPFYNAIYGSTPARVGLIEGDFINNTKTVSSSLHSGALINNAIIGTIKSNFIGNVAFSSGMSPSGSAINNSGDKAEIEKISGSFINNQSKTSIVPLDVTAGAISNSSYAKIGIIQADFIANKVVSEKRIAFGGAIYNVTHAEIGAIEGDFIGNYAYGDYRGVGGAIFNDNATIGRITGDFIGNYIHSISIRGGGGAIFNKSGSITIATTDAKKEILFENNRIILAPSPTNVTKKLNSIDFETANAIVNFDTIADSIINVRDPVRSFDDFGNQTSGGVINKIGAGGLALWGDNSEYLGKLNVKEGAFYAMFDEVQDVDNDPLSQRTEFKLNDLASVVFESGTSFRPMITDTKAAFLPNTAVINGDVFLVPYGISANEVGEYTYNYDYSKFAGWDNALASVDTSNGEVKLEIKRDLKNYKNLTDLADTYRMRTDLSLAERQMFDNIYYTGEISKDVEEKFAVIAGRDNMTYNEIHRSGVRQFGRQIASRTQNKNCPSCGMTEGYSDEHLWFNVGQNWIDRDSHGSTMGYKYTPTSLAIGYDYDVIPSALNLGVAISYGFGDVKGKGSSIYNTAEVDEYLVSLYWKYKPLRAYTTGSVGGGLMTNKTKVQSDTINTNGNYDTKAFFANAEFGYDFGNACGVIEPFVGIEYAYFYNDSYTEKGIGARHFDKMSWNSVEVPVGLRVSRNIYTSSYIFTPAIEAAYARSVGDVSSKANVYFVGNASAPWTFRGDAASRDSLRTSFNLKINNLNTPFAFNFGYARDTSSGYSDDQLYLTVRYNF